MLLVLSLFVCVHTTTKRNRNEFKMFFTNIENKDLTTSQFTQILEGEGFVNQQGCTFTDYLCTKIAENTQKINIKIKDAVLVFSNQNNYQFRMEQLENYQKDINEIINDFHVNVDFLFTNIYTKAGITKIEELKSRNFIYNAFIGYIRHVKIRCYISFSNMQQMIKSIQTANFDEKNKLYNTLEKFEHVFNAIKTVALHDLNLAIDSNKQTIEEITDFSYLLQILDCNLTNTDETVKSNEIKGNSKNINRKKFKNSHYGSYLSTDDTKNINLDIDIVINFFAEIRTTIFKSKTLLLNNKDVIKLPKQFFKTTTSILAYFDGYLSMKYIKSIIMNNNKATNIENAVKNYENVSKTLKHNKIDIQMFFLTFLTSIMACKLQIEKFEDLYNNEIFVVDTNAIYSELLPRVQYLEDLTKLTINNLNTIKNKMNNPTNLQINEKTVQINAHPSTSAAETSQQDTQNIHLQGEVVQDGILEVTNNQKKGIDNSTETNVDDYEFQLVMNMLAGNQ